MHTGHMQILIGLFRNSTLTNVLCLFSFQACAEVSMVISGLDRIQLRLVVVIGNFLLYSHKDGNTTMTGK